MANAEAVVAFCEARRVVQAAERASKDERAEQNDATRTLGGLLGESMQRHEVQCVAVPTPTGEVRYVKVATAARRSCPVKTDEDALSLIEDVASHLRDVPAEGLPNAVIKLVRQRARDRGPPPPPPRATVVTRPLKRHTTDLAGSPNETKRLMEDFVQAHHDRQTTRDTLKPLRERFRAARASLVNTLEAPVTVRMDANVSNARVTRTLCVERVPSSAKPRPPTLGLRTFLDVLHTAAQAASEERRDRFDQALRRHVVHGLSTFRAQPSTEPKPRIKVSLSATPPA